MTDTLDKGLLNTSRILKESVESLTQLQNSMTREQFKYYLDKGYTFLSEKQMDIVKTGKVERGIKRHVRSKLGGTKFKVAADHMEDEIEQYIRERANNLPMSDKKTFKTEPMSEENMSKVRQKRQLPISGPIYGVLSPFAFVPQVGSLQLYTLYVLSPQAFIPSYSNPAAFYMQLLSPWAFLANLFSPQFFTCLCLSPTIFEANLMSIPVK
uniref:SRP_SPB domain-containing protein n=1 Tax=Globodera pallida TaxID=36090 RepID=A0A183BRN7_GLOPA